MAVLKLNAGYSTNLRVFAASTKITATMHWKRITVSCGSCFLEDSGRAVEIALLERTIATLQKVYMLQLRTPAQASLVFGDKGCKNRSRSCEIGLRAANRTVNWFQDSWSYTLARSLSSEVEKST